VATKLYDPRAQRWHEHFVINPDATLSGITPEGRATVIVLRFNEEGRVRYRLQALADGKYPC